MKTYTISKQQLPTSDNSALSLAFIPKNIFQTFASTQLSEGAYHAVNSWRELNPTWTHYFFTDDDQRDFIQEHFSDDVLWAYDQLIPGAYKADLWRYCVLYIKGGVYVDHKIVLEKPLDDLLPADIHFVSYQDRPMPRYKNTPYEHYIWQAFLISEAGHPFLKQAIDNIVTNVQLGHYRHDTLAITGPGLLGQSINEVLGSPKDTPLPPKHYQQAQFDFHILENPFKDKREKLSLPALFGHRKAMSTYPTYYQERQHKSIESNQAGHVDYAAAWFLNRVYKHGKCVRDPNDLYYQRRLRGFYRRKLKAAFKQHHDILGRELLNKTFKRQPLQPKIWFCWLRYVLFRKLFKN